MDRAVLVLVCGHIFHLECWDHYYKTKDFSVWYVRERIKYNRCPRCWAIQWDEQGNPHELLETKIVYLDD